MLRYWGFAVRCQQLHVNLLVEVHSDDRLVLPFLGAVFGSDIGDNFHTRVNNTAPRVLLAALD